jgi:beta-galactosidase
MKLFNGQLVVIVRSAKQPGILTLKVTNNQLSMTKAIDILVK